MILALASSTVLQR